MNNLFKKKLEFVQEAFYGYFIVSSLTFFEKGFLQKVKEEK